GLVVVRATRFKNPIYIFAFSESLRAALGYYYNYYWPLCRWNKKKPILNELHFDDLTGRCQKRFQTQNNRVLQLCMRNQKVTLPALPFANAIIQTVNSQSLHFSSAVCAESLRYRVCICGFFGKKNRFRAICKRCAAAATETAVVATTTVDDTQSRTRLIFLTEGTTINIKKEKGNRERKEKRKRRKGITRRESMRKTRDYAERIALRVQRRVCVYLFDVGPCRARTNTSPRSQDTSRVRKFLKARAILIGSANNCIDTARRRAVSVTLIIRFALFDHMFRAVDVTTPKCK
ncbi:unnamed protein product, partial [Trichogramma brassicae]